MLLKINNNIVIEDYDNGKLLVDKQTTLSYYLENEVFDLLIPLINKEINSEEYFTEYYKETYTFSEYKSFISELMNLDIIKGGE